LLERKVYSAKEAEVFYVDRGSSFHGEWAVLSEPPRQTSRTKQYGTWSRKNVVSCLA
jgi:hypothetical protein